MSMIHLIFDKKYKQEDIKLILEKKAIQILDYKTDITKYTVLLIKSKFQLFYNVCCFGKYERIYNKYRRDKYVRERANKRSNDNELYYSITKESYKIEKQENINDAKEWIKLINIFFDKGYERIGILYNYPENRKIIDEIDVTYDEINIKYLLKMKSNYMYFFNKK